MARAQRRLAGFSSGATRPGTEIGELRDALSLLERQIKDREAIGAVFVGRYQVVSFVGAGAMGSVFRGWDPKLQRPVALKTIRLHEEETLRRARASRQLLHEAVTAARFSHPNIVAVYDVEDAPQAAFIALEFVDGTSLQRYLRNRSLPPSQVIPLGLAVARGLAAAHAPRRRAPRRQAGQRAARPRRLDQGHRLRHRRRRLHRRARRERLRHAGLPAARRS